MRWTRLAIAVAIGACARGERDQPSHSTAKSAAAADTVIPTSTTPVDTSPVAMPADSGTPKKGASGATTRTKSAKPGPAPTAPATSKTDAPNTAGPTGAEAMTGVRASQSSGRLSVEQVKRLQAALKKVGCGTGPVDGVQGARTQRAIACGLKKYELASDDLSGLYRKLGLDF